MTAITDHPELRRFLGDEASQVELETRHDDDSTLLRATQLFKNGEGRQLLFRETATDVELLKIDNIVEWPSPDFVGGPVYRGTMSDDDHAKVAAESITKLHYSTSAGPSGGELACLWIARRIVNWATGKWITQSDGTGDFYKQLQAGGMIPVAADTLPPGAIIISPTDDKAVGHIGLLGTGQSGDRLVYSNSSKRAEWEQNYTVARFIQYHQSIGLPTYFYRLPEPAI